MKSTDLLNAFQDVDRAFLDEADALQTARQSGKKPIVRHMLGWAAAAAAVCGIAVLAAHNKPNDITIPSLNSPFGSIDRFWYLDGHGGNTPLNTDSDEAKAFYAAFQAAIAENPGSLSGEMSLDAQFRGLEIDFTIPVDIAVNAQDTDILSHITTLLIPENTSLSEIYWTTAENSEEAYGYRVDFTAELAAAVSALIPQAPAAEWYEDFAEYSYHAEDGTERVLSNPVGSAAANMLCAKMHGLITSGGIQRTETFTDRRLSDLFSDEPVLRLWMGNPHTVTLYTQDGTVTVENANTFLIP